MRKTVTVGWNYNFLWARVNLQGVIGRFVIESGNKNILNYAGTEGEKHKNILNYAGTALKKYLEYYSPIPLSLDNMIKISRRRISFNVSNREELETAIQIYKNIREYELYRLKGFRDEFKSINAESPAEYIEKLKQVVDKYKTLKILEKL